MFVEIFIQLREYHLFKYFRCWGQCCITEVFPYNHIELDEVFVSEVNCIETYNRSIQSITGLLFNQFELNSDDPYSPMFDIDPDMNY